MSIPKTTPSAIVVSECFEGVQQALDPVTAHAQLSRLPQLNRHGTSLELIATGVCRHKPGRRCLIEYNVLIKRPWHEPQTLALMAKIRIKGHDHHTYALANALWSTGFCDRADDGIAVPEPMGEIPQWHMWLQRKVPGQTLEHQLAGPHGERLAQRVADAASKIHHSGIAARRRHTLADELRILDERLAATAAAYPHWSTRLERIIRRCRRLASQVPAPTVCGIHRDFYADQLIVDRDRLYVLDFDLYCEGDPALDIGNFIAHITEFSLRTLGDATALAHVERALEDRFLQLNPHIPPHAITAYVTLTLARHIYLSTQFADRQPFTQSLIELTEQRLDH